MQAQNQVKQQWLGVDRKRGGKGKKKCLQTHNQQSTE